MILNIVDQFGYGGKPFGICVADGLTVIKNIIDIGKNLQNNGFPQNVAAIMQTEFFMLAVQGGKGCDLLRSQRFIVFAVRAVGKNIEQIGLS